MGAFSLSKLLGMLRTVAMGRTRVQEIRLVDGYGVVMDGITTNGVAAAVRQYLGVRLSAQDIEATRADIPDYEIVLLGPDTLETTLDEILPQNPG